MRTLASPVQRDLVQRILAFAHWPRVRTTRQVEAHFARALLVQRGRLRNFRSILPGEVERYREAQVALRAMLAGIVAPERTAREAVAVAVARQLGEMRVGVRHVPQPGGQLAAVHDANGVAPTIALGLAFLLDDTLGLRRRFSACGWCGRFLFSVSRRKGRPRAYCTRSHYEAHERQASRARKERQRRAAGMVRREPRVETPSVKPRRPHARPRSAVAAKAAQLVETYLARERRRAGQ